MLGFFNERKLVIETRKAVFSQPDVLRLGAVADFGAQKLVRRTELSTTSKLSSGDETPPIANVLLAVGKLLFIDSPGPNSEFVVLSIFFC